MLIQRLRSLAQLTWHCWQDTVPIVLPGPLPADCLLLQSVQGPVPWQGPRSPPESCPPAAAVGPRAGGEGPARSGTVPARSSSPGTKAKEMCPCNAVESISVPIGSATMVFSGLITFDEHTVP